MCYSMLLSSQTSTVGKDVIFMSSRDHPDLLNAYPQQAQAAGVPSYLDHMLVLPVFELSASSSRCSPSRPTCGSSTSPPVCCAASPPTPTTAG